MTHTVLIPIADVVLVQRCSVEVALHRPRQLLLVHQCLLAEVTRLLACRPTVQSMSTTWTTS